jgi:hypothetical protein
MAGSLNAEASTNAILKVPCVCGAQIPVSFERLLDPFQCTSCGAKGRLDQERSPEIAKALLELQRQLGQIRERFGLT